MTRHHTLLYIFLALVFPCLAVSCVDDAEFDDSPEGNFNALWHIIDEHYC